MIDEWNLDELSKELNVDSSAVRQALDAWVDYGVVAEDEFHHFVLLERTGAASTASKPAASRAGTYSVSLKFLQVFYSFNQLAVEEDEVAPVMSAQQQDAEQMRVYWKVCN